MEPHFNKHYTLEEARALLPLVRRWLEQLGEVRSELEKHEKQLAALAEPGRDLGGPPVNAWVRVMAAAREILLEFQRREILLKDADRGLVDFPAIREGKEVFLCWEKDEDDIEFWHDLDAGYSGRERL